jgi:hypothetical protein
MGLLFVFVVDKTFEVVLGEGVCHDNEIIHYARQDDEQTEDKVVDSELVKRGGRNIEKRGSRSSTVIPLNI